MDHWLIYQPRRSDGSTHEWIAQKPDHSIGAVYDTEAEARRFARDYDAAHQPQERTTP